MSTMLCHHHICPVHLPKGKPVPTGQVLPILSPPPPRGKLLGNKSWGATSSRGSCLDACTTSPFLGVLPCVTPLSLTPSTLSSHLPRKGAGISIGVLPQALLFRAGLLKLSCQRNSPGCVIMEEENGGKLPQVQEH